MTPSGTPRDLESRTPDEARAAVTRLKDELAAAKVDTENRRTVVEAITATIGDRILDARAAGDNAAEVAAQGELMAARSEAEVAVKIVDALGKRIEDAERDVLRAEAASIRADVAERWPAIAARLDYAARLLDELHEAEGVRWLPGPWVQPSGACGNGSWSRTSTGSLLAEVLVLERHARALESRAGVVSLPSILNGRGDVALHLGNPGLIESPIQLKITGSQLDAASAVLAGKPAPETPNPSREQIMRAGMKG